MKNIDNLQLLGHMLNTPGELNYALTMIVKGYLNKSHNPNYDHVNEIMGAIEGVGKEFYRRIVAPYEDQKIKENGDVY